MRRMDADSVGKLGEHYVYEISNRIGCDWRPQHEKSFGMDGILEVHGRGSKPGDFVCVEIKTGKGNIYSQSKTHYSIRVDKKHTDYWLAVSKRVPMILVWYNNEERIAFWSQIVPETVNLSGSAVRISKTSRFGLYSAGDLKTLVRLYRPLDRFAILEAEDLPSPMTKNLKDAARAFYNQWRAEQFDTPAHGLFSVSLSGWRHITRASLSQAEITRRLRLLSSAKLILASLYSRIKIGELQEKQTIFYKQTAIIKYRRGAAALVSVVTKVKTGHLPTFHSVFEESWPEKGGDAKIGS